MKHLIIALLFALSFNAYAQPAGENPANWTVVNSLSDEFNGNSLNTSKWKFGHPWWVGRSPALFGGAQNAFVNNGLLNLKVTWFGGATNYLRSGAIRSNNRDMKVGMYSEIEFRSHNLKMGNGFWFAHNERDSQNREDEIDVQEAFPTRFPKVMHSNVHNPQPNFTNDQPQPQTFTIQNGNVHNSYHKYGVWIVNNRTLRFYLDGVFQKQITTNSTIEPLWMIINQETYDWITPYPTRNEVNNGAINTTYVNYVRTWRKVENNGNNGGKVTLRGPQGLVSSENGRRTMTANRANAGAWEKFTMTVVGNQNNNDVVTLKGTSGYVSSENGNANGMNCNRSRVGGWERFELIHHGNNVYSFKGNNGKYVSTNGGGGNPMQCNRNQIGAWERFNVTFGVTGKSTSGKIINKTPNLKVFYSKNALNEVSIQGTSEVNQIDVFDTSGKPVSFSVKPSSNNSITITFLEHVATGIYFVKTHVGTVKVMRR